MPVIPLLQNVGRIKTTVRHVHFTTTVSVTLMMHYYVPHGSRLTPLSKMRAGRRLIWDFNTNTPNVSWQSNISLTCWRDTESNQLIVNRSWIGTFKKYQNAHVEANPHSVCAAVSEQGSRGPCHGRLQLWHLARWMVLCPNTYLRTVNWMSARVR